ncbi:5-formyltetrahydrofolate cyclo-ligase [Roseomonas marmotae]|uniref:5-formyltetrahydrofolate cyclo-ligase n=1 Tax=Roseomonas marmotae TaxID=2768161 RepID=A0ABS3KHS1_9PROT|nr:5-formyltetrahydrofolate cyclo-ligase [Roseomonas marmotae]MBO1077021.1 5-formyltetrahydrofolate cyclo-ligase [Roseomonas marmotae]QTI78419.1 5-formyltetrahydrofolate cyclo-ligase [Roseomonas marmotae]
MAAPLPFISDSPALVAEKAALRQAALTARAALRAPGAAEALAEVVLRDCPPPPGVLVGGFWPMGGEIDIRPLLRRLEDAGHALALPVTPPRGQPLAFRRWRFGEPLLPGRFGTSIPAESAGEVRPGALLVPLLAFDARGLRLGYGGGYYDRTLAALPGIWALGVAFAGQQVAKVPAGAHDVPLHGIATEAGFLPTEG